MTEYRDKPLLVLVLCILVYRAGHLSIRILWRIFIILIILLISTSGLSPILWESPSGLDLITSKYFPQKDTKYFIFKPNRLSQENEPTKLEKNQII